MAKTTALPLAVGNYEFVGASARTYIMSVTKVRRALVVACSCPGFSRWSRCKHATLTTESKFLPSTAQPTEKKMPARKIKPANIDTTTKKETAVSKPKKSSKKSTKVEPVVVETIAPAPKKVKVTKPAASASKVEKSAPRVVKSTKSTATKVPAPIKHKGLTIPVGVPVNVKVEGERVMRKAVTLRVHADKKGHVQVLTGRRGRPASLPVASIERVRAL